jgi:FAD dependent monooxygenase
VCSPAVSVRLILCISRFGYPLAFLDRQKVLELLGASLPCPDKLHVNTKVFRVDELADGLRVHTASGACYDGDIVVGADGVHSVVRQEMWRLSGTSSTHEKKREITPPRSSTEAS